MKKFLLAIFVFLLYDVVFGHTYNGEVGSDGKVSWSFSMTPRIVPSTIWFLIATPFIILFLGLIQWKSLLITHLKFKPEGYSSYRLRILPNEKPSKWQAYLKY